ncbi:Carbohydrate kinase, FGGY [Coriobacterium glomerans PW2]|uniref:Carbohydrate kinase, FGGY n=1 Tax=Coriobacterium glomerans (strain ATCC 49209 / DSM 20642 / JCM 10262 / PW2) TaxID=700015 RepID=F2NAF5_CORGP|nr:FGGY-family carbohydrate kinase [Coriobacterium glomerans]AEB06482.1 Carbohydrate kinase, FGGY [Coriobacterium glomerans PW2]
MVKTTEEIAAEIERGAATLGIEFGSTRIKAQLNDENNAPVAVGAFEWENSFEQGYWTYGEQEIFEGLAACFASLKADVARRYRVDLRRLAALGISAMMHGYLALGSDGEPLVPFRTWRNTTTTVAARELTRVFGFHIPERWSVAHLYQAILDEEPHVAQVDHLTTLAGFVHERLCGRRVLSIGDASGMFPIDSSTRSYDASMADRFDALEPVRALGVRIIDLLPEVMIAGQVAGHLTAHGAELLDASGDLEIACPMCPPEGDAGTGMIATNSVAPRTGNVSAGTSIFSMVVLEQPLKNPMLDEIDIVTTPVGDPVAMVHCNNCTSDINAWMGLFESYNDLMGISMDSPELYETLFRAALDGDADAGGLMSMPFISGEPIMGVSTGCPLLTRGERARLTIQNFMRMHIMAAFGALKIGNDALRRERVAIDRLYAHGGIFKTPIVAQRLLAAAMAAPVSLLETAGEGGAWGAAIAAAYMLRGAATSSLSEYLSDHVFKGMRSVTVEAVPEDVLGYDAFIDLFRRVNAIACQADDIWADEAGHAHVEGVEGQ